MANWTPLDSHVDWITATAKIGGKANDLLTIGITALQDASQGGGTTRKSNFQGYNGYTNRGAFYGWRLDGACVRFSGELARRHWRAAVDAADNVSRFDIAVTLLADTVERDWALDWRIKAETFPEPGGHPINYTLLWPKYGGETLYVGSRASERFGRMYDKHKESNGVYPEGAWRYEIEYKGKAAGMVSASFANGTDDEGNCYATVARRFNEWHIPLPLQTLPGGFADVGEYARTTNETRFKWLNESVAHSIEHLAADYTANELRSALGLSMDTSHTRVDVETVHNAAKRYAEARE